MKFPENLKYSNDHEWLRIEGDQAYVGITDFAQHELGDIVFVDVDTEGETLDKDEIFGSIAELEANAAAINTDPYNAGWIIKMKITNPSEVNDLMDSVAYTTFIGL